MSRFKDVFETNSEVKVDEAYIAEYFKRKELMEAEKKALDDMNNHIKKAMIISGRDKAKFGNVVVSVTTPNTSKFDMDKVLEFVSTRYCNYVPMVTKQVVDEDKLEKLVAEGIIDKDALVEYAFVESKGTPRATYKYVGDSE